ncbi:MAG: metallophosphoesterase family protein, partial [Methanobacteriota archaeon]
MRTRLFYVADIHGSDRCFKKLLNAAKFYDAQVLMIGGDLTGKMVVTFVENPDGTYRSDWLEKKRMKAKEVAETERTLSDGGLYTARLSAREMEDLEGNPKRVYTFFNEKMQERLRAWIALAQERLRPQGLRLYVIPGNDDRFEIDDEVRRAESMVYCEGQVVDIGGYEVASCGFTNPTPWHTPRELAEDDLAKKLDAAVRGVSNPARAIFNFHGPPIDTAIDVAPQLTPDLKVVARAGTVMTQHVGSTSVRKLLEERQPMLGLHGHIHESRGDDRIGRTLVLNPGSEYNQGILHGVL